MNNTKIIKYTSIRMVRGKNRGLLMDLQKEKYYIVPLAMIKLIEDLDKYNLDAILNNSILSNSDKDIINEYLTFLFEHDLVFKGSIEDKMYLTSIEEKFETPEKISNVVLDFDKENYLTEAIVDQFDKLDVRAIQIRYYSFNYIEWLSDQLACFHGSTVRHIDLLLPYDEKAKNLLSNLAKINDRISFITFYNSSNSQVIEDIEGSFAKMILTDSKINNEKCCGKISSQYFSCNLDTYLESLSFNSCLNKKMAIDKLGNIKNCPSMPRSYGSIGSTNLNEVLIETNFKQIWKMSKDNIITCKDCEFRYVCTDCRAYLENPNDITSKPLKCGYDIEKCEWNDWSTNPLKNNAILYYDLKK